MSEPTRAEWRDWADAVERPEREAAKAKRDAELAQWMHSMLTNAATNRQLYGYSFHVYCHCFCCEYNRTQRDSGIVGTAFVSLFGM